MTRIPEQQAAKRDLTDSVTTLLSLHDDPSDNWVVSEYVVIAAQQRIDDEGAVLTAISVLFGDDVMPVHVAMGLVEYARQRLVACALDPGE